MLIHVCSLARLHATVQQTGARHIVTLINAGTPVERPEAIAEDNHLFLGMNDINEPQHGFIAPDEQHIARLLGFVRQWHSDHAATSPLVIHCWAGVSRSTAGAFIAACALDPERDEAEIAGEIRRRSPSATPNARLVALADQHLRRDGRMIEAIRAIGRGRDTFEGDPFHLPVLR